MYLPALLLLAAATDLRLDYTRQSLTATYRHYTQYAGGVPLLGGEVIERVGSDGSVQEVYRPFAAARPARRVIIRERPHHPVARYLDAETGAVIREVPLYFNVQARVFEVNPVAKLNAPELRDQNNAAGAVPDAAYTLVDLLGLAPAGMLAGPRVQIAEIESPSTPHADASQSLMFDRSQPQFEEVNVYYAIDRTQRYLESLGYVGTRAVAAYAIPVDPHAFNGSDNSIYESSTIPGQGILLLGDGGTDDAEDSDIVLHEYTHAIQDWIAPGAFFGSSGSEARALAEGIADYWAFSQNYAQTVASGRDPYCIGDWDARCDGDDPSQECGYPPGADCLRRVDGTKTMADFRAIDRSGQEHENGAIWSSALREIFDGLNRRHGESGRRLADQIVIESMFGVPSGPTFAILARNALAATAALSPGDRDIVCGAFTSRAIAADCDRTPHGELTYFQSPSQQIAIDDTRAIQRAAVRVDVAGDAAVTLIAPDGTSLPLHRLAPFEDLPALQGHGAAGIWTLRLTGAGVLRSWTLAIQFAGDAPFATRPVSTLPRKHIAAVAHVAGVGGSTFVSDVRVFNRGNAPASITVVYTPDAGGFGAFKLVVAPKQIVALDDVVGGFMQAPNGLGSLEFQGDVAGLIITSRTFTASASGTYGQFIPSADTSEAIGGLTHAYVAHLRNDAEFRSNVGFAEVGGGSGVVRVSGVDVPVAPFQHWQMPATGTGDVIADFSVVSGGARILAYGSMIDNASDDAIYVPARVPLPVPLIVFAPAISAAGALGTRWSSEVVVSAPGVAGAQFDAHFGGATATASVPYKSGNILRELFNRDGTLGLLRLDLPAGAIATSRIYTGSYGQFVPFPVLVGGGELVQLDSSADFRVNLGAANIGVAPIGVRFTAFDSSGNQLGLTERVLQPGELTQFPLRAFVAGDVRNARVRVEGAVLAYASVVDNRSGDAIYVPAQ